MTEKLVPLSSGKFAIVSEQDYERVTAHKWSFGSTGCAYRQVRVNGKAVAVYMSRFVLGVVDAGILVDHINGDRLDNRRENLRPCTKGQNQCNQKKRSAYTSSRFKGVSWDKSKGRWRASIGHLGKHIHLGRYRDEKKAAAAYNAAAKKMFGEFARLNGGLND